MAGGFPIVRGRPLTSLSRPHGRSRRHMSGQAKSNRQLPHAFLCRVEAAGRLRRGERVGRPQTVKALNELRAAVALLDLRRRRHRVAAAETRLAMAELYQSAGTDWDAVARLGFRAWRALERDRGSLALRSRALGIVGVAQWYREGPSSALPWFERAENRLKRARHASPVDLVSVRDNLGCVCSPPASRRLRRRCSTRRSAWPLSMVSSTRPR